ncbi:MAG TPA: hypothetical protein PKH77_20745 [Anaerolineae bacterium]|nr:hypothetical protein [Anaerolineae bacterium]
MNKIETNASPVFEALISNTHVLNAIIMPIYGFYLLMLKDEHQRAALPESWQTADEFRLFDLVRSVREKANTLCPVSTTARLPITLNKQRNALYTELADIVRRSLELAERLPLRAREGCQFYDCCEVRAAAERAYHELTHFMMTIQEELYFWQQ